MSTYSVSISYYKYRSKFMDHNLIFWSKYNVKKILVDKLDYQVTNIMHNYGPHFFNFFNNNNKNKLKFVANSNVLKGDQ